MVDKTNDSNLNTFIAKTNPDYKYKFLMLGDSKVGKTNLVLRYCENVFQSNSISTVGIDSKVKNIKKNNENIKITIWDTAGQERFRSSCRTYIRGTHGLLMMYDVTDKETFSNIPHWIDQIYEILEDTKIILIANKIDLENERVITYEEGKKLADKKKLLYIECSAKSGKNVNECFQILIDSIYDSKMVEPEFIKINKPDNKIVDVNNPSIKLKPNKQSCCNN